MQHREPSRAPDRQEQSPLKHPVPLWDSEPALDVEPGENQGSDQQHAESVGNPPDAPQTPKPIGADEGGGSSAKESDAGIHRRRAEDQGQHLIDAGEPHGCPAPMRNQPGASQRFGDVRDHEANARSKGPAE